MTDENGISDLYHRAHRKLVKRINRIVEPYELNRGELTILATLMEKGDGFAQKEILADLPISKSTMSNTIDNLVEKGYLRKEEDPEDKRVTVIYLTEKGEEAESTVREIDKKVVEMMLKRFSESEKEELTEYLEKLLKNLGK